MSREQCIASEQWHAAIEYMLQHSYQKWIAPELAGSLSQLLRVHSIHTLVQRNYHQSLIGSTSIMLVVKISDGWFHTRAVWTTSNQPGFVIQDEGTQIRFKTRVVVGLQVNPSQVCLDCESKADQIKNQRQEVGKGAEQEELFSFGDLWQFYCYHRWTVGRCWFGSFT